MKRSIQMMSVASLLLLFSLPGNALYFNWDNQTFANATLEGIKTVTVDVDPPIRSLNDELKNYGVSDTVLEERISQRLRDAGFNVINAEQAITDPEAALLKLRIRMIIGYGLIYSYGLDLSLNQKASLNSSSNSYYSVETWSASKFGGTQQTSLGYLNNYSMGLVEDFIAAHRAQN